MTDRSRSTPTEIDDIEDRMGSVHPLDFDQDKDARGGRVGDLLPEAEADDRFPAERAREAGMSTGEVPDGQTTQDDLAPETLIPDDGARSPDERGHGLPADLEMTEISESEAGLGDGLDEAEEGRARPLDGEPWDGPADQEDSDSTLEEDDEVLSDEELEGDALLDSTRDRKPDA